MKIETKNIEFHNGHGDSESYNATIYVNGQKAFHASNDGWGGPDMYDPLPSYKGPSAQEVNEWLAANTPQITVETITFPNSLDIVVGDILLEARKALDIKKARKQFENLLKKKVLGFKDGKLRSWSVAGTPENVQRVKAYDSSVQVVQGGSEELKERAFLAWCTLEA